MRTPKQPRAAKRRESILDAAAALLESKGYEGVTTNALAKEARASVGTVYQYFPNKEAVLLALLARYRERLAAALLPALEHEGLETAVEALIRRFADFYVSEPGYAQLWLGTQLDWATLRQLLLRLRIPEGVVATLDHALLHGLLTRREWARRRDAARLRLGSPKVPLMAWGPLLGSGALQAFLRLERVEENALLRSSPRSRPSDARAVRLHAVDVERGGQRVLQQIDLSLAPGEWVLVCGPSGAGKSVTSEL